MMATALAATGVSMYTKSNQNSKYDLSEWGSTLSSFGLIFIPAGLLPYKVMGYGMVGANALFVLSFAYHTIKLIVAMKQASAR